MGRNAEIGNVVIYPSRPLNASDKNGYQLKFFCPIRGKRIRKNCGTRNAAEARKIQRECKARLASGEYVASGGSITEAEAKCNPMRRIITSADAVSWDDALAKYLENHKPLTREKSYIDSESRINIVGRIFQARHKLQGIPGPLMVSECYPLEAQEYLRLRLLEGVEGKPIRGKKGKQSLRPRAPSTVNSMMATFLPFLAYCESHDWIPPFKRLKKINVDEPMKGRPITGEEFDRLIAATPLIVGDGSAESWIFCLRILWASAFRIQDLLNFSWDNQNYIHPVWPRKAGQHPTIMIPSAQKNGKWEEIPMLPELTVLLGSVPADQRTGWVVNPRPREFTLKGQGNWFKPCPNDLAGLVPCYSNASIAQACGVSDLTVGNWLKKAGLMRTERLRNYGQPIPETLIRRLKANAEQVNAKVVTRTGRPTADHLSKVIAAIGEQAGVVVKSGGSVKYASAHDIRRSVASRLVNAGVSAETLKVLMRHDDFSTTEKFYGAKRQAQSAAAEIAAKLTPVELKNEGLVGGLVGGLGGENSLTPEEFQHLKSLLKGL